MSDRVLRPAAVASLGVIAGACAGAPSALDPRGTGAARIESLWWLVFWIATAVFLVVVGFLAVTMLRGRRHVEVAREVAWGERFIVLAGVVVPSVILISVFVVSLRDVTVLDSRGDEADLTVEVTSHDWWWEARYPNGAVTANEIHIPAGEPVRFKLLTEDVIHSFWVPQLQAKVDHVSGRENSLWIEADEPGRFRGQCAEFCGLQHANMAFYIVAERPADFDRWLSSLAQPAEQEASSVDEGKEVFLGSTCVGCHAVAGTEAEARVGPDLTHLAARETLFAATVANTRANLAKIIVEPQSVKLGVGMPPTELSAPELNALLDYLESLE